MNALESAERLKTLLPQGKTLHATITDVSGSGMTRWVRIFIVQEDDLHDITYMVANACGFAVDHKRSAIRIGGCGFNACHEVTSAVAKFIYGDYYALKHSQF